MARGTKVAVLMGLLWVVGSLAGEISIDYHRGADFSGYKTFAWQKGVPAADPSMDAYILGRIEAALTAAGMKRVDDPEKADLHVLYSVSLTTETKTTKVSRPSLTNGLPKWDYEPLVRQGAVVSQNEFTEGTLLVVVEEARTSTLLWTGVASGYLVSTIDPEANRNLVDQAVRLMFKNFPPQAENPEEKPPAKK